MTFCSKGVEHDMDKGHYLAFLKRHIDEIYNSYYECLVSLHPRNIKSFTRSSYKYAIGKWEVRIIKPSWESFMEYGMSCNNNLLFPLVDVIAENSLHNAHTLIQSIYGAIFSFNDLINSYPAYKNYLDQHTDYNHALVQTIQKNPKFFSINIYDDEGFISKLGVFFLLKLSSIIYNQSEYSQKDIYKNLNVDSKFERILFVNIILICANLR